MKALAKTSSREGLELVEAETPRPGPGEVLIKVAAASICGTDLHIYSWDEWSRSRISPPRIIGHEFCGHVEEVGPGVEGFAPGDYVSAETHIYCGRCYMCRTGRAHLCENVSIIGIDRDGAFAEYIVVPAKVLWKNDPALPAKIASLQEPFGNAVHAVKRAEVGGKRVVIIGDGPIGIFACAIARVLGARDVWLVGLSETRLAAGRRLGADAVVNASSRDPVAAIREWTGGKGADVVLEMSGSPAAWDNALRAVRPGGRVIAFGLSRDKIPWDLNRGVFKDIEVLGIVGRLIFETWYEASELLAELDLTPAVTDELPLEEFEAGFERLFRREAVKVVLYP
ncbi:MAG: L-threonine 3-dehydrogenase [Caldiserica bacterium]|nr:L-threonine 3-dehydrogenase [Caldisericota bacterium]